MTYFGILLLAHNYKLISWKKQECELFWIAKLLIINSAEMVPAKLLFCTRHERTSNNDYNAAETLEWTELYFYL